MLTRRQVFQAAGRLMATLALFRKGIMMVDNIEVRRFGFPDGYDPAAVHTALSNAGYTSTPGYGGAYELLHWWIFKVFTTEANRTAVEAIIDGEVNTTSGIPVAVGSTVTVGAMVLIQDVELSVAAANFDFTSIPAYFRHLRLEGALRSDNVSISVGFLVRLQGDSGANYDWSYFVFVSGTGMVGSSFAAQTSMALGDMAAASAPTNNFSSFVLDFPDYTDTTKLHKVIAQIAGAHGTTAADCRRYSGMGNYRTAGAINRITIIPNAGNLEAGSRVSLYGIG